MKLIRWFARFFFLLSNHNESLGEPFSNGLIKNESNDKKQFQKSFGYQITFERLKVQRTMEFDETTRTMG